MWRVISLAAIQCLFLSSGQVFLKLAMARMEKFSFTWSYFGHLLTNWWLLATGASMTVATVLWLYILKHFDFSIAYPITALGYVFGMLFAFFIFHETIPLTRWLGMFLIMAGVVLIAK
ncbi:MAG: EamA family transporter [Bacteroidales bacterium]|jgi:undecaprenyl phosphate-alpha-L-ara4N flippase subunit ArnE|nr:EamA family transporter [Bacteroidales bacterium]